jgi:hypothetical protein
MRLALLLFDQMTSMDLIGFYDPITRLRSMGFLPELEWEFCARTEEVRDDRGLIYRVEHVNKPLTDFDLLFRITSRPECDRTDSTADGLSVLSNSNGTTTKQRLVMGRCFRMFADA